MPTQWAVMLNNKSFNVVKHPSYREAFPFAGCSLLGVVIYPNKEQRKALLSQMSFLLLMTCTGLPMGSFELTFKKRYAHRIIKQILLLSSRYEDFNGIS